MNMDDSDGELEDAMIPFDQVEEYWNLVHNVDVTEDFESFVFSCSPKDYAMCSAASQTLLNNDGRLCNPVYLNELHKYKDNRFKQDPKTRICFVNAIEMYSGVYILVIGKIYLNDEPDVTFLVQIFRQGCYNGSASYFYDRLDWKDGTSDKDVFTQLLAYFFTDQDVLLNSDSPCVGLNVSFRELWLLQIMCSELFPKCSAAVHKPLSQLLNENGITGVI